MTDPTRFRGFALETRNFLRDHGATPPHQWTGGIRDDYAHLVLAPLKDLCIDVAAGLQRVEPNVMFEARVGGSLHSEESEFAPPVHRLRFWDRTSGREASPELFVELKPTHLEIGVFDATSPLGSTRLRRALLPDPALRAHVAGLPGSGWEISGEPLGDADDGAVPTELRPWMVGRDLRVALRLDWDEWADEPGLAVEIVDRLREVMPLFAAMREEEEVARAASTNG